MKKDTFKNSLYNKNLLLKESIKIIDLKDRFDQKLNPVENLFFKNDGHWNNGHKIIKCVQKCVKQLMHPYKSLNSYRNNYK